MDEHLTKMRKWLESDRPFPVAETLAAGIPRHLLTHLCSQGVISRVEHGIYLPVNADVTENLSLQIAALRVPNGVVCLLSALRFHNFTTQVSPEIWLALRQHSRIPAMSRLPARFVMLSDVPFQYGMEEHDIDGIKIRVYSAAKTVADCFKFRNRIGLDVALEALRDGVQRKLFSVSELMNAAKVCRVSKIITPYVESIFS